MMKKTLALLVFIVLFGSAPTNANAFWWLIARSVIGSEVKHKHHDGDQLHRKENQSRFDRDADYDGYNPYHNHPNGKYSHEYTENHEKHW